MKSFVILTALIAVSAFGENDVSSSFTARRARNELLAERFTPSCARMRVFFKHDRNGEVPEFDVLRYCPNCKDYHSDSVEEYLKQDCPVETTAFAISPDRFLVQDFHILPDWIDRVEIVFGGKTYPAREVARYPDDEAVEILAERPVDGVKPLVFSKRLDFLNDTKGVFFFSTKEHGLAVCGTLGNSTAEFVRFGDIGKDIATAVGNAIAVNASNEAVTVSFRDKFALGDRAFLPPTEWKREPIGDYVARRQAMKEKVAAMTVPVYIHLDDENNRKDGFSRRYRDYGDDSDMTELDLMGLVLPEGEVLVPLDLDASKMSEIDRVEAVLADGTKSPLEFVGAFDEVKAAVFRFAEGGAPNGLTPVRMDARRCESRFLEPAYAVNVNNYNGKSRVTLKRVRISRFQTGRGGETQPVFPHAGRDGRLSMLVYSDGSAGGVSIGYRQDDRWRDRTFVTSAKLQSYLSARDFDPQFAIRKGKDRVRVAWIGVETQRVTEELAREKKVLELLAATRSSGALVTRVWTNSPAAKAGIAEGDILLTASLVSSRRTRTLEGGSTSSGFDWDEFFSAFEGESEDSEYSVYDGVYSPWPDVEGGLNGVFTDFGIGKRIVVAFAHDGVRKEAELTLEQAPVHYQTAKRVKNKALGIIVSDMTFEVRGYFKLADDAPGVVIAKIQPGFPAAISGLRPLEIITHVNNEPVTGAKDFVKKVKGRQNLTFSVRRLAATRVVRIELKDRAAEAQK